MPPARKVLHRTQTLSFNRPEWFQEPGAHLSVRLFSCLLMITKGWRGLCQRVQGSRQQTSQGRMWLGGGGLCVCNSPPSPALVSTVCRGHQRGKQKTLLYTNKQRQWRPFTPKHHAARTHHSIGLGTVTPHRGGEDQGNIQGECIETFTQDWGIRNQRTEW